MLGVRPLAISFAASATPDQLRYIQCVCVAFVPGRFSNSTAARPLQQKAEAASSRSALLYLMALAIIMAPG
jgi:hypothetical protein